MRWLLRFSTTYPWFIVGLVLTLTVAACLLIPRVRLELDGRSLIPEDEPSLQASDRAASVFGLRDVVVIGIAARQADIYNSKALGCVARLSERLAGVEGIVSGSVTSLATMPRLFVEKGKIDTYPLLTPGLEPDRQTAERIRRETQALGLNDGVLVATDGSAAAIFAEVRSDADRQTVLEQVRRLVKEESGLEEVSIHLSGTALAQAILGEAAARDLLKLIPAVILVLGIVLMLAFRHPVPALISLAEIGASLLLTVGFMGLTGQSVFVTTLVMPVILIAVGVSDDVYALTHFFDEAQQHRHSSIADIVVAAFSGVARSIGITALSTIVGLLSIAAAGLEPFRVFGIFGALAILFSSLFTFTLVPSLIVLMNPKLARRQSGGQARGKQRVLLLFSVLNAAGPRRILWLSLGVAACALLLTTKLRVDDSWVKNLPAESDIARGDKNLNRLFAGTITLDLMFDSGQPDGFLQSSAMAALGAVENRLAALPSVGAIHSVYGDVARVRAALAGTNYQAFRAALKQGSASLSQREIEEALLLMASVRRLPIAEMLDSNYQRTRLTIFIRSADYERIDEVLATASAAGLKIVGLGGDPTPFGDGWVSYLTVRLLVQGQVWSIALGLLTDLALLSLLFRSLRTGVVALLPVVFSLLVVFAVLAVTRTPLGIANSMFAGIAIGIGLDFSIHLTSRYREGLSMGLGRRDSLRKAFIGTVPAILTSAVAITAGFSVLALSEISPNLQLGLIICLSLLVCAAATLVLVPSLVLARSDIR
jgi:uncharacterized protein